MSKQEQGKPNPCDSCRYARGQHDDLVMSPGDTAGDAVWCTNGALIKEYRYESETDEKYGYGTLLYKVGVIDEDATCDYREAQP